VQEKMLYNGIA